MSDLVPYLISFFGGAGLIGLILFLNPEKVEKWGSYLWRAICFVVRRGEKKIVALDIQGRVNEFVRRLNREAPHVDASGIKVEWITGSEQETADFFRGNRLVIRMRQHEDQDRNFVNASMVFISRSLLPKAKKYLSPTQKESLDLFVGRKLFEREKPTVVDRFFEDYFSSRALDSETIMELLEKYAIIDKVGVFFPVLVQELSFLGEKVFYKPRNDQIIVEVTRFIRFLEGYANREVGQEVQLEFVGAYCCAGIVIVAKRFKRELGDVGPYLRWVRKLIDRKIENVYLLGSAEQDNRQFIEGIATESMRQFGLEQFTKKEFRASIKMLGGERQDVKSVLIHLRVMGTPRYYDKEYQEKFLEASPGPISVGDEGTSE